MAVDCARESTMACAASRAAARAVSADAAELAEACEKASAAALDAWAKLAATAFAASFAAARAASAEAAEAGSACMPLFLAPLAVFVVKGATRARVGAKTQYRKRCRMAKDACGPDSRETRGLRRASGLFTCKSGFAQRPELYSDLGRI